ncbi:MAG TPA: isoprenylcysteine carboxylmethyltransferase family protein [Chloroflexota bacterium]|nr:isoprenylcysteine carboxylmethyltransferase family protein [Chloroflexota bacterium]
MSTAPSHTAGSRSGAVASLRFIWGLGPTTLAAVVLAVAIPGSRTRLFRRPAAHTCAGAALFGAGLAMRVAATWEMLHRGQGTPIYPIEPMHLVTSGLFAWSRNPLYVAKLAMLAGLGLMLASRVVLALAVAWWVVLHRIVIPAEERSLRLRFGQDYVDYLRTVPRWIRLTP